HANRERERHPALRPPAVAADVGNELVEARVRERLVLHLADGPEPGHAEPDGGAHDPRLRERRVDTPVGPQAGASPGRCAEDAAGAADVLAHHEDGVVPLQLDVQAVVDRLDERALGHRVSYDSASSLRRSSSRSSANDGGGSAYACSNTSSGSGSGSASASLIPARMSSSASARIEAAISSVSSPARRR